MAEAAINMPHPQRPSSEQDIVRQGFSPVRSVPRAEHSANFDQGAALHQQRTVSNVKSNSFTNHGQVTDARDASLQGPMPHFLKTQSQNLLFRCWNFFRRISFMNKEYLPTPRKCSIPLESGFRVPISEDVEQMETCCMLLGTSLNARKSVPELEGKGLEQLTTSNDNETIERDKRLNRAFCAPLLQAALKGDWQAAKDFLEKYPRYVRAPITKEEATALHNAAAAQRTEFVKELVKLMNPNDLKLETIRGCTALYFAAQSGIVEIAEEMVKMKPNLPLIRNDLEMLPLYVAAMVGKRDMVSYLLSVTPFEKLTPHERINVVLATISTDLYDMACEILKMNLNLTPKEEPFVCEALQRLARKPLEIGRKNKLSVWERCLKYSCFNGSYNKALMQTLTHQLIESLWKEFRILSNKQFSSIGDRDHMALLVEAAKLGNVEFLVILIRSYPDLLWQVDKEEKSIFHIAISYRQESVLKLIHEIGNLKSSMASYHAKNKNNMLHLAGQLPPSDRLNVVSGAALQMQRELLWFQEVKQIVPPIYVDEKNTDGETPWDIFLRTHKELRKDGEKWMKDTSNSCMLVATLIATVVFTAAFTIPGGSNQETGTPILMESNWFMVFFISDAIAMLSSSTSILIFLSILTSRYTEKDFLKSLPARLVFGLIALFISVAGMVVAFSAACFLVYESKNSRVPISIIVSAGVPIILFAMLHYHLWVDIIRSILWSRFRFRPGKHRLF